MGCSYSKSSSDSIGGNDQNHKKGQGRDTPQKGYSLETENGDGANERPTRPAPSSTQRSSETAPVAEQSIVPARRAHQGSEGTLAASSFGTENYSSKKNMIISAAAGQPHLHSADAVREKIQMIREELEEHNNEIITDAEREYFIEQRCWDFYFPDEPEIFMVYRPRSSITEETMPDHVPVCNGCAAEGQSMDVCPWVVLTSCPIFHHKRYNVRFGYEVLFPCPQCAAESEEPRL